MIPLRETPFALKERRPMLPYVSMTANVWSFEFITKLFHCPYLISFKISISLHGLVKKNSWQELSYIGITIQWHILLSKVILKILDCIKWAFPVIWGSIICIMNSLSQLRSSDNLQIRIEIETESLGVWNITFKFQLFLSNSLL